MSKIESFEQLANLIKSKGWFRFDFNDEFLDLELDFVEVSKSVDDFEALNKYSVYHFPDFNRYLEISYYNDSYNSEFIDCREVTPRQKIVIVYD